MDIANIDPEGVLDVGANVGDWTRQVRKIWPDCDWLMIEANRGCEGSLATVGEEYLIETLSDSHRVVDFFSLNATATGGSYYRELTADYMDVVPETHLTTTLSALLGPRTQVFDFWKLDTQGSELDILRGAGSLLRQVKWLLIEVSMRPYNNGAPLFPELHAWLTTQGFPHSRPVIERPYIGQADILYMRSAG